MSAATHPYAAGLGIPISKLFPVGDRLYVGYGDWSGNRGPVHLTSYAAGVVDYDDEFQLDSEAVENYRVLSDGRLWALAVDRRNSEPGGGHEYAVRALNGTWTAGTMPGVDPTDHVFDVAEFDGELFLCGSDGGDGRIWRSVDDGANWTVAYVNNGVTDPLWGRIYGLMKLNPGTLVAVRPEGTGALWHPGTEDWQVDGPIVHDVFAAYRPEEFAGRWYLGGSPGVGGVLVTYDPDTEQSGPFDPPPWVNPGGSDSRVIDWYVSATHLYVLGTDQRQVWRTTNGSTWEPVVWAFASEVAGAAFYSIAEFGGELVLGDSAGGLWRCALPA